VRGSGAGGIDEGSIMRDAVFEAIEFPASVTDLNTSLTDVNGDDFAHDERLNEVSFKKKTRTKKK
jgi:hypothetical protein